MDVKKGDIFLTRGSGIISKAIRLLSKTISE